VLILDIKEIELMYVKQTVNVSTNIHNERIKTEYIPSYISENGVGICLYM